MKALLFTLLITGTEPAITYEFVPAGAVIMTWEECSTTAYSMNENNMIETGGVTAVCFPITDKDIRDNERSRQHS